MIKNPGTNLVIYRADDFANFLSGNVGTIVNIPDGTTSVRSGLFNGTTVQRVNFPASITSINGFANCLDLGTVNINPAASYAIQDSAFSVSSMPYRSLNINVEGCTSCGSNAFFIRNPKILNFENCTNFAQNSLAMMGNSNDFNVTRVIIHQANLSISGGLCNYGGIYTIKGFSIWFKNYIYWGTGTNCVYKLRYDKIVSKTASHDAGSNLNKILILNCDAVPTFGGTTDFAQEALYVKPSLIDQYKNTAPFSTKNIYPAVAEESDLASIDTSLYTKAYVNYDSETNMYSDNAMGRQFFYVDGAWVKQGT